MSKIDIYSLDNTNTDFYGEHKEWYDKYRAASIGDLIDRQQDIIDRYEKAINHSTTEINELKDIQKTNEAVIKELETEITKLKTDLEEARHMLR